MVAAAPFERSPERAGWAGGCSREEGPGGGRSPDAMPEAKRTLVKSGPELWAELSDPAALARHLAPFGSVRLTRTEPETLVAWEGDRAEGEVALEASGFGTRVTLRAHVRDAAAAPPAAEAEPPASAPAPEPEPAPEPRRGFWARLFRRRSRAETAPAPAAMPVQPPEPPEPIQVTATPAMSDEAALLVLTDTLDALGRAHHRPFSRS